MLSNLPPCIDLATAEHVNFIGQSVRLLRHPKGNFQGEELLPFEVTLESAAAIRKLQEQSEFNRVALDRTIEIIRSKEISFLFKFKNLNIKILI